MVLAHPAGCEWKERQPEKQVEVRPEHAAGHLFGGVKQVMMVVPVDADVDETQCIAEKVWKQWSYRTKIRPVRNLQFQDHDGDDDRHHTIAECLESTFS